MTNFYRNKTCLITGATGGLGKELVGFLVNNHSILILVGQNKKKLIELKKKYDDNKNIYIYASNFNDRKNILATINKIKKNHNRVDILFNVAGIFSFKKISKISIAEYDKIFNINFLAPLLFCKKFIYQMNKYRFGRIINIGSSSSYLGFKDTSLYCSSKHALLGLTRSLQDQYKNTNIKLYSFLPGSIKTKMGKKIKNQDYSTFIEPKELAKFIVEMISLKGNININEIKITREKIR